MTDALRRPDGRVETIRVLVLAVLALARFELLVRRTSWPQLCDRMGVGFEGFDRPSAPSAPLPRRLPGTWWGIETVLRVWPWGRDRQCLRRSLALGHLLRESAPVLRLEVITLTPFRAHARLEIRGYRLDMGETGPLAETDLVA